jgi:hypothetical protein
MLPSPRFFAVMAVTASHTYKVLTLDNLAGHHN